MEDRALARKSSKTSNENRLIRGGCFITPITPSLELSLIFVPQSVQIERPSCFSGSSESFVKNVLRRRSLYPTELRRHSIISSVNTEHRYYTRFKLFCKPFVLFRPELEPASWSLLEPEPSPEPPLLHLGCTIADSWLHSCRFPATQLQIPGCTNSTCSTLLHLRPFNPSAFHSGGL